MFILQSSTQNKNKWIKLSSRKLVENEVMLNKIKRKLKLKQNNGISVNIKVVHTAQKIRINKKNKIKQNRIE